MQHYYFEVEYLSRACEEQFLCKISNLNFLLFQKTAEMSSLVSLCINTEDLQMFLCAKEVGFILKKGKTCQFLSN